MLMDITILLLGMKSLWKYVYADKHITHILFSVSRSVWGNDATNSSLSNFTSIGANISSSLLSNMSMASLGSGNGTSQQPDYYVDSTTEFWQ